MKRIYTEAELRSRLSNYANERIESITCTEVEICIRFKDGFRNTFKGRYEKEIYTTTIAAMKEACKVCYITECDEADMDYTEQVFEEMSLEAQELTDAYGYSSGCHYERDAKGDYQPITSMETVYVEFKEGVLNDYHTRYSDGTPSNRLDFTPKELERGAHIEATKPEHFVCTPTSKPLEYP